MAVIKKKRYTEKIQHCQPSLHFVRKMGMNPSLKRKEKSQWKNIKGKIDISTKPDFQREVNTYKQIFREKAAITD